MPRRFRYAKTRIEVDDLSTLSYGEMVDLARREVITWIQVNAETRRRVIEANGGDPYAHLRDEWGQR